ncbi:YqzM family protein [Brevibacillus fulvus]|uniref:Cytochrome c551/cytochrome c550 n=1 Tax=Brevibacillus fulvus TaxID=1125967 RepID=A0A939BQZ6_9BACL|nr:YqzM family protein [Brevibacillus fulvus]MBM7592140.1 cytochrome c551/cytochrome c550 [Brevibacillus fulvus]
MAGSNKKDMNQNDIVDSARAFTTSFGILFLVFLIALVASVIFPPQHGEEAQGGGGAPTAAVNGEAVFKANCASCHGQNLEGVVGPNLTKVGSKYNAEQIMDIIKNGKGGMPPGVLKKQPEIQAVAEWLAEHK